MAGELGHSPEPPTNLQEEEQAMVLEAVADSDAESFRFTAAEYTSNTDQLTKQSSATMPDTALKENLVHRRSGDGGPTTAPKANGHAPKVLDSHIIEERESVELTNGDYGLHPDELKPSGRYHESHPREHELPDGPRGDDTAHPESAQEQEGATGRGPGKHEGDIPDDLVEGQGDDDYVYTPGQQFPDGEPKAWPHDKASLPNERGEKTVAMPGVKTEEPPGPRSNIELNPRLVHLQYHNAMNDLGARDKTLVVAPDGEEEIPLEAHPRQFLSTPSGERRAPVTQRELDMEFAEHGLGRVAPSGEGDESAWEDMNLQPGAGHWRTAIGSKASSGSATPRRRPKPKKRFTGLNVGGKNNSSNNMNEASSAGNGVPGDATPRGGRLKRMNPLRAQSKHPHVSANTEITAPTMTNEMMAGTLPVMILKTWLDRDEEGHRAVPVLIGNLRFRIGDSLSVKTGSTRNTGRELFKIECEYGDGAIKWVIYRDLRDFLSLHAHYKTANFGHRVIGSNLRAVHIPEFPRNALPYWARDKYDKLEDEIKHPVRNHHERHEVSLNEKQPEGQPAASTSAAQPVPPNEKPQARRQESGMVPRRQETGPAVRDALQQYLIDVIRAVMFRPESNRLCIFFELSALTVALGPRGGFQGKAGFLRLPAMHVSRKSNQPGLLPTRWKIKRSPKWFIVRESYCVATAGPAETEIYDVFLMDNDFAIERPKRAYRKGLHLLSHHKCGCCDGTNLSDDPRKHSHPGEDTDTHEMHEETDHNASRHTFYISNAQRRIKLQAKNAATMHQFIVSMERVAIQSIWAGRNRFDSFAPIRVNVAAQWLVDGRDYFWNLSRAINMAKSRIYIHDWWISPEIYLRRPGDERYRLDNLLKRKAEEGVRIFIIIYNEVLAKATPVASQYVKSTLTGLHPNIMMQRSPSHLPNGTFYWSHHEKLCVIDETIAFMGGLDLCFGRWDTSQHILTDEDHTEPSGPNGPVWRGKDYANERIVEFSDLEKPFEDSIDRSKTPRMPWHDVGLSLVGQPARDLCRHFIQRWNYLLRIKNHTRKMPFLLPPADFTQRELKDLGLQGTCEVQICRSVGPWSMGTMTKIEHSITNAYIKSIQLSEHFVYIENQFFITSTIVDNTPIENRVGDALVQRIIRAHKNGEKWRACVVIPLLPGYTHPVDSSEASSVRLILECQNRTICRGTHSIFSRLRKEGINPDDYISFFSLRTWAKFKSGALTTEQVYIHGKTMIVDDRLVLCGSANINERSQRGDRDSELLAVVRDTDMIDGTMAGKPFKVGRYAHTLRVRLMREHVGVDVDALEEDELMLRQPLTDACDIALWDPDHEQDERKTSGVTRIKKSTPGARLRQTFSSAMGGIGRGVAENVKSDIHRAGSKLKHPIEAAEGTNIKPSNSREEGPGGGPTGDASERQDIGADGNIIEGFASSVVPTLEEQTIANRRPHEQHVDGKPLSGLTADGQGPDQATVAADKEVDAHEAPRLEMFGEPSGANQGDTVVPRAETEGTKEEQDAVAARHVLRKHLHAKVGNNPWNMPTPTPKIDPNRFHDPLDERFWKDMWVAVAVHNTQIFRKVFRCVPDDMVTTWAQYKEFANHMDKFGRTEVVPTSEGGTGTKVTHDQGGSGGGTVGPAGQNVDAPQGGQAADGSTYGRVGQTAPPSNLAAAAGVAHSAASAAVDAVTGSPNQPNVAAGAGAGVNGDAAAEAGTSPTSAHSRDGKTPGGAAPAPGAGLRNPSGENDAWQQWELHDMEELLKEVRGHLVVYPTRFLEAEDMANNFLFNQERILPLLIYD